MRPFQRCGSESAATIEEDEDHGWTRNRDQKEGRKVGDQMEIDSHGRAALQLDLSINILRSAVLQEQRSCKLL